MATKTKTQPKKQGKMPASKSYTVPVPMGNGAVTVPLRDGYQKRRIFVSFVELLEDERDIELICQDLRKVLTDYGENKDLHVEVEVWRQEKA